MASKWIQKADIKKGSLHSALGIPEDKKIPESTLKRLANYKGKNKKQLDLKRMAVLAMTLAKFHSKKKKNK